MNVNPYSLRTGIGYDIHRMSFGRPCVIGGVTLPFPYGPNGHSDGDVLTHAICDALLGAAGEPDIGNLFPDTDPQYQGIDSQKLLGQVNRRLREKNFHIINIDATVVAQKPSLQKHRETIAKTLSRTLGLKPEQINVKATTNEQMDAIGQGLGISAQAICLLFQE
ncbi:MAG: 2-C-methyl-D-erythritol 2,4-cyclodiphosphate synthase [Opitutales bacterium]|nr:2-C-methyl-D-erythritol 2,4-cyclodiphosphate synthase [Opitutales bacterium]MCH8539541.1 2-C-methyl-D-erythritol 2,4-cyclodiphosphate synthase [Opitutales bacterium]